MKQKSLPGKEKALVHKSKKSTNRMPRGAENEMIRSNTRGFSQPLSVQRLISDGKLDHNRFLQGQFPALEEKPEEEEAQAHENDVGKSN